MNQPMTARVVPDTSRADSLQITLSDHLPRLPFRCGLWLRGGKRCLILLVLLLLVIVHDIREDFGDQFLSRNLLIEEERTLLSAEQIAGVVPTIDCIGPIGLWLDLCASADICDLADAIAFEEGNFEWK
jgi:hypothetical protein